MKKVMLVLVATAIIVSCMSIFVLAADKVGCAACHTGTHDLTAEAKGIDGHPPVPAGATYDACAKCHKSGKLAFGPILHKGHLTGADNHFMSNYGGACTACHVLDANAGTFTVAK